MPQRSRDAWNSERGASAVEFALIVSVLILLLFGIIEFGLAWHRTQGLQAAAREGARIASVGFTLSDTLSRVRASQSLFQPEDIQISVKVRSKSSLSDVAVVDGLQRPCQIAGIGGLVTVDVIVPEDAANDYGILIPLWGEADIRYTAVGAFRCEKASAN